jgi:Uncharacterized conserved protein
MNRTLVATLALFATLGLTTARAETLDSNYTGSYANDAVHTRLLWKIRHMGLSTYTARLNEVSITIDFDANDVSNSSVVASANPLSVDTGYVGDKDFDEEIYSGLILDAENFPSIDFRSTSITERNDGSYDVAGELTLLGVTRPVTLRGEITGQTLSHPFMKVPALGFHVTGTVDRLAHGLDFLAGSGLGNEIMIEIQTEMIKQ